MQVITAVEPQPVEVVQFCDSLCTVLLSENIARLPDGMWQRDRYGVETEYREELQAEVEADFEAWLQRGKDEEANEQRKANEALAASEAAGRLTMLMAAGLGDEQALEVKALYPAWAVGTAYKEGERVRFGEKLYRARRDTVTHDPGHTPEAVPSEWAVIEEGHAGTVDDPIPAQRFLEYAEGKYYIEDDVLYLCTREYDGTTGHLPSVLVGHYFEVVNT